MGKVRVDHRRAKLRKAVADMTYASDCSIVVIVLAGGEHIEGLVVVVVDWFRVARCCDR